MQHYKHFFSYYTLAITIIVTLFVVSVITYAWTEPTQAPPGGNVLTPINVGDTTQYKSGALGVEGAFHAFSTALFDGNVSIGGSSPDSKYRLYSLNPTNGGVAVVGEATYDPTLGYGIGVYAKGAMGLVAESTLTSDGYAGIFYGRLYTDESLTVTNFYHDTTAIFGTGSLVVDWANPFSMAVQGAYGETGEGVTEGRLGAAWYDTAIPVKWRMGVWEYMGSLHRAWPGAVAMRVLFQAM